MNNKRLIYKIIDGVMMGKAFNTFLVSQILYYLLTSNTTQLIIHVSVLIFSVSIHTWNEDRKAKLLSL